jgi:hypothetical protein
MALSIFTFTLGVGIFVAALFTAGTSLVIGLTNVKFVPLTYFYDWRAI